MDDSDDSPTVSRGGSALEASLYCGRTQNLLYCAFDTKPELRLYCNNDTSAMRGLCGIDIDIGSGSHRRPTGSRAVDGGATGKRPSTGELVADSWDRSREGAAYRFNVSR